ncbi:Protein of unknown function [Spirosomataceae bacterium TFI 002]|nr:Protein of unknown function [Spirosomataceae bacterium TFI 002]
MGKLANALGFKCARCGKGEMFTSKNPYKWGEMMTMHTHCPNCGMLYEREGGFFYGAMYISYALNIALFVTATVGYYLFFDEIVDWRWYISGYVALTVLLSPVLFRLSRSIWLMIMTKYEPEKSGER